MQDDYDKADLLELIFDHYELRWPSSRQKVCCPVHDEDRPSCIVDPVKGFWHCYACNKGGDAYALIQIREGVRFPDAKRFAADVLERSGRSLREGTAGFSGAGVSGGKGDRPGQRRYVPSWLR